MRTMFGIWDLRVRLALTAAAIFMSQSGWAQDNSATENRDDGPGPDFANAASPEDKLSSVIDVPFKQYVDISLLRDAFASGDAATMVDIGLQLKEGERVLQRSHRAFESRQILEIAVRLASAQQDADSLARLAKAAEISGDKALGESVATANQLAGQQRAAVPPLPEATDTLSLEEISALNHILMQLETAKALGSRETLQAFESRVKQSPLPKGEFRSYLEAQLAEAISQSAEAADDSDATLKTLEALSGGTRAITLAPRSLAISTPNTSKVRPAYVPDACPVQQEVSAGTTSFLDFRTGTVRTAPKNTVESLRAQYGAVFVNYGTFMEIQVDAQGNAVIENAAKGWALRAFPRRGLVVEPGRENQIKVVQRRPEGGWFTQPYTITMNEALTWALEMSNGQVGPMKSGNTPLLSVANVGVLPERVMVKKSGSFNMREWNQAGYSFTEIGMLEKAEGASLILTTTGLSPGRVRDIFTKAGPNGTATISQIVAAGGGNITVSQIVAAGGGNIVAAGGGNIVAAGGGNIVAAGGGNVMAKVALAVSETFDEDFRIQKYDFLIGKGGASLAALIANNPAELGSVTRQIDLNIVKNSVGNNLINIQLAAEKLSLMSTGTRNIDFINAKLLPR